MRLIGTLSTDADAVRFGNYLLSIGMPNRIEAGRDGQWQIWVEHDDHLEQATSQLHAYQANPNDPRYAEADRAAAALRRREAAEAERRRANFTDVRTSWAGAARARPTPVSIALIVLCIVVAVLTKLNVTETHSPVTEALVFQPISAVLEPDPATADGFRIVAQKYQLSTMFSSIFAGQVWRLLTPIFLHFGPIHLIFNLSWLYSLGFAIEMRRGSLFMLWLVLVSALLSNCAQALWAVYGPFNPIGYSSGGGFSGVNYALFGYVYLKGRLQPYEGLAVNQQTVGLMIAWLFICMTGAVGPVANAAHVGGFITGAFIGAWQTLRRKMGLR